ncbi:MAG TPA: hypothetical protein VGP61_02325, partial [Gemmatimonadales bacterium]|nr:hypothetical protein [Gemmatimonadales bacterium]
MSSTLASTLTAQTAAARVLIGGGTATDLRGVRSGAYAVAPSVLWLPDPHVALNLGARGTRFSNSEWSLGGSLGGVFRIHVRGGLALLLTGSGDVITTSYRVNYFLAEALPALEWSRGSFSLWGGARGAAGRTVFESTLLSKARPPTPRSLLGPAFGGRVRLASFGSSGTMELSYREEHGRPDGTPVADRTTGLALSDGRIALNGTLGVRRAANERVTFGSAQLVARVTAAISLVATAERYPSNPLT